MDVLQDQGTHHHPRYLSRADSAHDITEKYAIRLPEGLGDTRTEGGADVSYSTLRSVPIDHSYSYDLVREIKKEWSACGSCCLNDASNRRSLTPPPAHCVKRKTLEEFMQQHSNQEDDWEYCYHSMADQASSPLFNVLPPEIREHIWSYLLTTTKPVLCVADGGLPAPHYNLSPNILSTCQRILHEALPVLYGRNRFSVFHIPNMLRSRTTAPRFALWPQHFARLRHLSIDVPDKAIERWYRTHWGAEYEAHSELLGALVRCAGPTLRRLQLRLVRNCALESYAAWGPYLAPSAPLMRAVAERFLPPRRCGDAPQAFVLVVSGGLHGFELDRCFDVLRPDALDVVHAVACGLGALQREARERGRSLDELVVVRRQE